MTVATSTTTAHTAIPSQRTSKDFNDDVSIKDADKYEYDFDIAVEEDFDDAKLTEDFFGDTDMSVIEPTSEIKAQRKKRAAEQRRHSLCRVKARLKRRATTPEKKAPVKTIELTKSIKDQIWVAKKLKCSTDWNRVKFDAKTFVEFNKLVSQMPTKRRAWFRQRYYYAGVATT